MSINLMKRFKKLMIMKATEKQTEYLMLFEKRYSIKYTNYGFYSDGSMNIHFKHDDGEIGWITIDKDANLVLGPNE